MSRKWVLDTSPLIALGKVSQINLFEQICSELVIPEGVAYERGEGGAGDPALSWIRGAGASFVRRVEGIPR